VTLEAERASGMPSMSCRELIGFLCDYLLGRLAPHQSAAFEAHLDNCPSCVAFINDIHAVARLGRCAVSGASAGLPEEVPPALVIAVYEARDVLPGARETPASR